MHMDNEQVGDLAGKLLQKAPSEGDSREQVLRRTAINTSVLSILGQIAAEEESKQGRSHGEV
jgi:hypothetical protein